MKTYLQENSQLLLISIIWLVVGMYAGPLIYVVAPVMILLMYKNGMEKEILLGFFFVLILSDNRLYQLGFAANLKNIYILLISFFSFLEMRKLKYLIMYYKYFIPFFLIAFISMFFNPNIVLSFQKTLSYVLLFVFVPNYFLIVYKKYGDELMRAIIFTGCSILFMGIVFHFLNPQVTTLAGRYRGLLGNPNGLGLFVFLFFSLFIFIKDKSPNLFKRPELIVVYFLCFYSLLMCGARASLAATLMFLFFKRFYKLSPVLGFFIFVLSVIVFQYISDHIADIVMALGLEKELRIDTLKSGSGRQIAWEFAWEQIQFNFFMGKGFSYTEYLFHKNYEYLSRLGHEGAAHNSYLTFWLDTGLVGVILYIGGMLITFLKASKISKIAIPLLYAVLFSNQYESWLTASLNPFTIQLLFILTVIFLQDADEGEPVIVN